MPSAIYGRHVAKASFWTSGKGELHLFVFQQMADVGEMDLGHLG